MKGYGQNILMISNIMNQIRYRVLRYGATGTVERVLIYYLFRFRYQHNRRDLSPQEELPKVIYIDPEDMYYSIIPRGVFPSTGDEAFIGRLGGGWDRWRIDIEDTILYGSLEERFNNDARWEETEMYRLARWAIEHDMAAWGGSYSKAELREYCRSLDALYESIREEGYSECDVEVTRKDEYGDADRDDGAVVAGDYVIPDEPRIGRGRRGEHLRLSGGKHRIVLSKLLGIEEIPVVVLVEHEEYSTRGM